MKQDSVIVKNEVGLHARPAALIVKEATKYKSKINIIKGENSYNGKSIISVLSMCAIKNDELTILAEGEDECEAVSAIKELIANYEE
ncbi:MAG: HPr family phosphocarrier protein [Clostridium sp.]|uniref:HPr family phosphocarrier protein n=1 Tax=Clostridium sp. TaxID=1506 RepID=UPI00302BBAD6